MLRDAANRPLIEINPGAIDRVDTRPLARLVPRDLSLSCAGAQRRRARRGHRSAARMRARRAMLARRASRLLRCVIGCADWARAIPGRLTRVNPGGAPGG